MGGKIRGIQIGEWAGKVIRFLPLFGLIIFVAISLWQDVRPFVTAQPPSKITGAMSMVTNKDVVPFLLEAYRFDSSLEFSSTLEILNQRMEEQEAMPEEIFQFAVYPGEMISLKESFHGHFDPYQLSVQLIDAKRGSQTVRLNSEDAFSPSAEGTYELLVQQKFDGFLDISWRGRLLVSTDDYERAQMNIVRMIEEVAWNLPQTQLSRDELIRCPEVRASLLAIREYGKLGEQVLWESINISDLQDSFIDMLKVCLFSQVTGIGQESEEWGTAKEWATMYLEEAKRYVQENLSSRP